MTLGAPVKPYRCRHTDCLFPEGGPCAQLHDDPAANCEQLVRLVIREGTPAPAASAATPTSQSTPREEITPEETTSPPWAGLHLSLGAASELTLRAIPRLIAVLGPFDAGKTSLLASFFLQVANGEYGDLPYRFASSRTLLAWDRLILRANHPAQDGSMAEHSPPREHAEFLHLGFCPTRKKGNDILPDRKHIDVLLSDISGEQIIEWSEKSSPQNNARMAFVRNADAVLVAVDAARLAEPTGRAYDTRVGGLLRRLGEVLKNAPRSPCVLLVFCKMDRVGDERETSTASDPFQASAFPRLLRGAVIRAAMENLRANHIPTAAFATSAFRGTIESGQPLGVVAPFARALEHSERKSLLKLTPPEITQATPSFVVYGATRRDWE